MFVRICGPLARNILTLALGLFRFVVAGDLGKTNMWCYLFFFILEAVFWVFNIETMNSGFGSFSQAFVHASANDTEVITHVEQLAAAYPLFCFL